jgi:hypothetical protein
MALVDAAKNIGLDAIAAAITHVGLHSGAVGSGSGSELSGGSPAYARQAVSFGSASGGSVAMSGTETFDVPAGGSVTRVGLWSASTSGTFYGDADLTDESYAGQGTYQLTALTISIT